MNDIIELSVVIPVFRNENTLIELADKIRNQLSPHSFEIIFVNDASPDNSSTILTELSRMHQNIQVINLLGNIGQQKATLTGLKKAKGEYNVVLDADLQDRPELIIPLYSIQKQSTGSTFVFRKGLYQKTSRMITSTVIKLLIQWISGLHRKAGSFYIVDKVTLKKILKTGSRCKHPYMSIIVAHHSKKINYFPAERPKSIDQSSYNISRRLKAAYMALYCACYCRLSK